MPALVRIGCEFTLGMATYELRRCGALSPLAGCLAAVALVGTTYWSDLPAESLAMAGLYQGQMQVGLLAVLVAALSSDEDVLGRWLTRPWPLYLGEISYSIYMVHWFVLAVLRHGAARALPQLNAVTLPFVGLCLVVTLLAASLLYRVIEAPGRRLLRAPLPQIGWRELIPS
jgi:peptidoglycan/LPS O-acetylase OafA/YrhL